jgi:hypothetical protein
VAGDTVWLGALLLEGAVRKLLLAKLAHEMLRMEAAVEGNHAPTQDGLLAGRAEGPLLLVIMRLAVRTAFVLKEAPVPEWLLAFLNDSKQRHQFDSQDSKCK